MAGLLAVVALPAQGQGTETAKVFTEDAPTVAPGSTEIQLSYTHDLFGREFDREGDTIDRQRYEVQILALSATHGLRDGLDLSATVLGFDVVRDDRDELDAHLGNVRLNAKWRIFESETTSVKVSWLPGLISPFADLRETSPGQDFWSLDSLFVATWVSGRFNLSGDAGFALAIGSGRESQLWAGLADLAIGYQVAPWFQPLAELNAFRTEVVGPGDARSLGATLGAVFNFSQGVRLDLGAQKIIRGRNTDDATIFLANLSVTF